MNNAYSGEDRRRSKRLDVAFILTYQINHPLSLRMITGAGIETIALMLNLSENGMAVSTNYNIPAATIIAMKFTLINLEAQGDERTNSMRITGEVKSNVVLGKNEYRLGIHFTQINDQDKVAIANFVKMASIKKPQV